MSECNIAQRKIYRGDVFFVSLPPELCITIGSEQGGSRPAVIVGNDIGNKYSSTVLVAFLTSRHKKPLPTHVSIKSLPIPSTILCEQIRTVSKARLKNYMGHLTKDEMEKLDQALKVSMQLVPIENTYQKLQKESRKTSGKTSGTLLEDLSQMCGCMYLSDLHNTRYAGPMYRALLSINMATYDMKEWEDAVQYITTRSLRIRSPEEAMNVLQDFLKTSLREKAEREGELEHEEFNELEF